MVQRKLVSIFAAVLAMLCAISIAPAATIVNLPVDSNPQGDVYHLQLNNLTGPIDFSVTFNVDPHYTCYGNTMYDYPSCPYQGFTGFVNVAASSVTPSTGGYFDGITLCNGFYGNSHSGSATCSDGIDSKSGTVTVANPFIDITLSLFQMYGQVVPFTASLVLTVAADNIDVVLLNPSADVPLPGALPLLAAGLGFLGMSRAKKNQPLDSHCRK